MALVTITDQELTDTALLQMRESADGNYKKLALQDAYKTALGEGKPSEAGGSVIIEPVQFGDHSSVTEMISGFEPINLGVTDVLKPAQYQWHRSIMPIAVSGFDIDKNSGKAKVLDLVKELTKNVMGAFMRRVEQQLIAGGVVGFSQLSSLNGVDYTTGFLEENAYASQTNVVGNLSKATYNVYPGWANQAEDAAGSISAGGWAALTAFQTKAQNRSPFGGTKSFFVASENFYSGILRVLQANRRYGSEETIDGRPKFIKWGGAPIHSSTYMPNAGTTTTATPISAYGIDPDCLRPLWHENGYYRPGDFVRAQGFETRVLPVVVMCQLTARHLGGSGVIVNGENF